MLPAFAMVVPGESPRSPHNVVAPVLLIADAPSTEKACAVPSKGAACDTPIKPAHNKTATQRDKAGSAARLDGYRGMEVAPGRKRPSRLGAPMPDWQSLAPFNWCHIVGDGLPGYVLQRTETRPPL